MKKSTWWRSHTCEYITLARVGLPALHPSRWDQRHSARGSFYGSLDSRTGRCLFSKPLWQPESIFQAWDQIQWLSQHKCKNGVGTLLERTVGKIWSFSPDWSHPAMRSSSTAVHLIMFYRVRKALWLMFQQPQSQHERAWLSLDSTNEILVTLYMHRDSELVKQGSFIFRLSLAM